MGMHPGLMIPRRGGPSNSAPVITVGGARTVSWALTGVTPKPTIEFSGVNEILITDANAADEVEATLAVLHGTLTLNRDTFTPGGAPAGLELWTVRVPTSVGAFQLTVDGHVLDFDSSVADLYTPMMAELNSEIPGYGIGSSTVNDVAGVAVYEFSFSASFVNAGNVSVSGVVDAGLSYSTGDGTADPTIVVTGKPANLKAILARTVYIPDDDYAGADTLTVNATDGTDAATQKTVPLSVVSAGEVLHLRGDIGEVWEDTAGTDPAVTGNAVKRVDDVSGAGNHATQSVTGAAPILSADVPSVFSGDANARSLNFDGTDDGLRFTSIATGTTWTWCAWIKPKSQSATYGALLTDFGITYDGIYYRGSDAGGDAGKLTYRQSAGDFSTCSVALTDDAWQFVALVVSAGNATWYLGSSANGTVSGVTTIPVDTIGTQAVNAVKAILAREKFYAGMALSATQIAYLVAGGA